MLKIIKYAVTMVIAVFLLFNLWNIFARNVLEQDMPKMFGLSSAVVASGSMEPEFSKGDFAIIKSKAQYEVVDIICFKDGNSYTTHRIVGIDGDNFVTKGDANNTIDKNTVDVSNVVGEIVSIWTGFGTFIMFLHSFWGLLILFVLGLLVILSDPIIDYFTKKKSEVRDERKV